MHGAHLPFKFSPAPPSPSSRIFSPSRSSLTLPHSAPAPLLTPPRGRTLAHDPDQARAPLQVATRAIVQTRRGPSSTPVLGPSASRANNEEVMNGAVVDNIDLKQLKRAQVLATTEKKRRTLTPSARSIGTSDIPTNATRTAQRPHSPRRSSMCPRVQQKHAADRRANWPSP